MIIVVQCNAGWSLWTSYQGPNLQLKSESWFQVVKLWWWLKVGPCDAVSHVPTAYKGTSYVCRSASIVYRKTRCIRKKISLLTISQTCHAWLDPHLPKKVRHWMVLSANTGLDTTEPVNVTIILLVCLFKARTLHFVWHVQTCFLSMCNG